MRHILKIGLFNWLSLFWFVFIYSNHQPCRCYGWEEIFYLENYRRLLYLGSFFIAACLIELWWWIYRREIDKNLMTDLRTALQHLAFIGLQASPMLLIMLGSLALPHAQVYYWALTAVAAVVLLFVLCWRYVVAAAEVPAGMLGVLLVFVWMGLLKPAAACDCAKITSVRVNMYQFQLLLHRYKAAQQAYPETIGQLKTAAEQATSPYWHEITNPLTGQSGTASLGDFKDYQPPADISRELLGIRIYPIEREQIPHSAFAGKVLFSPTATGYVIYGVDQYGRLIREAGSSEVMILSNL